MNLDMKLDGFRDLGAARRTQIAIPNPGAIDSSYSIA